MQEFVTRRQGYRMATSVGGVLTGRGADLIIIDDPLKPEEVCYSEWMTVGAAWGLVCLFAICHSSRRSDSNGSLT